MACCALYVLLVTRLVAFRWTALVQPLGSSKSDPIASLDRCQSNYCALNVHSRHDGREITDKYRKGTLLNTNFSNFITNLKQIVDHSIAPCLHCTIIFKLSRCLFLNDSEFPFLIFFCYVG